MLRNILIKNISEPTRYRVKTNWKLDSEGTPLGYGSACLEYNVVYIEQTNPVSVY